MKQGVIITRVVMLVLCLAVASYIGAYVVKGLSDPYKTVVTYSHRMDDAVDLSGVVVRQETAIGGQGMLADVLPQEGEKIAKGATVAVLYQDPSVAQRRREINTLRIQLEQLDYALRRSDYTTDGTKMDEELVQMVGTIRSQVSAGNLGGLEETGLTLRSLVIKRSNDLGSEAGEVESSQTIAAIQEAIAQTTAQLTTLEATAAQYSQRVTVSRGGTFSGLSDGYEETLTPQVLETITAAELLALGKNQPTISTDAIGKLITDSRWYYATTVSTATAQRITPGQQYKLGFSGDFNETVTMRVDRLGEAENGRHVVVFSSTRYLADVTMLRHTGAQLIFQSFTGVRVPTEAVRVLENEDGTTSLGVYVRVGSQAEFKPVEIVREGEGFYLVKGIATNRRVLRAGDEIILSNEELYNGKVVG